MSLQVSSLRAVAHPVRLQMLSLLTGVAMSAAEIARELGITQANASYHVRVLAAAGLLAEAGQENVRVWAKVVGLVAQASALIHESAQPPRTAGTVHVSLSAVVFEMDDARARPAADGATREGDR